MPPKPGDQDAVRQQQLQEHDRWEHAHAEMREEHLAPVSFRLRSLELRVAAIGGGLALAAIVVGAVLGDVLRRIGLLP